MSQTAHGDLERGNHAGGLPDESQSTPNQPLQPSQEKIASGDSSRPLYAMYSRISQEEDNRIAELHQRSADGILIFTGLFSATVAALLSVSIPDLKPNTQDTSAFYLANIYQLFANSNASDGSTPSTLSKPPAFSPPRYVVWVNSLWLLALLMSLTGALLPTLVQRWSLRYLSITQDKDYSPEWRARVHARMTKSDVWGFSFRDGSGMLFCLRFSLFLFIAGVLIYFFNMSHAIFGALVWWIAIVTVLYALITVLPLASPEELFYTPFSSPALTVYLAFPRAVYQVCSWIRPLRGLSDDIKKHYLDLRNRYSQGFIEGKIKSTEEASSKPSSEIDTVILERMLFVLDEDHALEAFFDALPGFCDSKLVQKPLDSRVMAKLQESLDGFLDRTFSSRLATELVRSDRLITCLNAAHSALGSSAVSQILGNFFEGNRDEALKSVEIGHCLRRWGHSRDDPIEPSVRRIIAGIIARAPDRDEQWTMLIKEVSGVPDGVLRDYMPHGNSALLAILIHITREALRTDRSERCVLESLSQFDVRDTLPELQHDFCTLWNAIVQEATKEGASSTPTETLAGMGHLFAALHQGTGVAPLDPGDGPDAIMSQLLTYPSCSLPSHRPHSVSHGSATTSPSVPPRTQLSDAPQALPRAALASRPPLVASPDAAIEDAMPSNVNASNIVDPMHGSTASGGPPLQQAEENSPMPPSAAFCPLPTPIPTPALGSRITPGLPPPIDSTGTTQSYHVPRTRAASSLTLTLTPLSAFPHATTISGQYPGVNKGPAGAQDNTQDLHPPIPREGDSQPSPGGATGL